MTAPRRVALIGCGDISSLHLAAIADNPGVRLVGVCDPDPARGEAAARQTGTPWFSDHRALLDELRPDVVHICTPHAAHADIAVDALERGIHVVLEKPLAHDREAGERVVAAAAASSAKVAVCFQNRYNSAVQRAAEILASGELGAVEGAVATVVWHRTPDYYLARPWRGTWAGSGGGLLMNQAIHTLDLLQWLLGEVIAVTGQAGTRVLGDAIEVEDTADLVLSHATGARSVFFATLAHIANEPVTLEIRASEGALSLRGDLTVTRADGRVEVVRENAVATGERAYWGASHARLIDDFYRSLDAADPFWIDAAEAQKTLNIIQDVYDLSYPERAGRTGEKERSYSA